MDGPFKLPFLPKSTTQAKKVDTGKAVWAEYEYPKKRKWKTSFLTVTIFTFFCP